MNICSRCGATIKQDTEYCTNCGQKIDNSHLVNNELNTGNSVEQQNTTSNPTKRILLAIAAFIIVANVILVGVLISKKTNNDASSNTETTQNTTSSTENETTTEDATSSTTNTEDEKDSPTDDVITGVHSYTGTINVDGLSCCLKLEKAISFQAPLDTEPITSDCLWIDESDIKIFKGYNGLTVTLKGELFNYRGGGTLMFNGTPTIESVSGTPNIVPESSSYVNWDTTDNKTKFWDATEVLKTIIYECDGVWDVRVLCDEDVLNRVEAEGFSYFDAVMLSINGDWVSDYGYDIYLTPDKEYVYIALGPNEAPDITLFTYSWSGEFVNGEMPLDEYIVQQGLT